MFASTQSPASSQYRATEVELEARKTLIENNAPAPQDQCNVDLEKYLTLSLPPHMMRPSFAGTMAIRKNVRLAPTAEFPLMSR